LNIFNETVLTLNKFWRWFTADLIVHWVRRVFFPTLSGSSCVTILMYTLILYPQFTKVQKTKQATNKKISTSDYLRNYFIWHVNISELSSFSILFTFSYFVFFNKCGHRNMLSKRQVWMSIFHIINFKKL
jgi:hypothetical protein